MSGTGARHAPKQKTCSSTNGSTIVATNGCASEGADHRANHCTTYPGIDCTLISALVTDLELRKLATIKIIRPKLFETLARPWQHHHARTCWHSGASSEQEERDSEN